MRLTVKLKPSVGIAATTLVAHTATPVRAPVTPGRRNTNGHAARETRGAMPDLAGHGDAHGGDVHG